MGPAILGLLACALVFGIGYAVIDAITIAWQAADWAAVPGIGKVANVMLGAALLSATTLAIVGRAAYLVLAQFNRMHHAVVAGFVLAFTMNFIVAFALLAARTVDASVVAQVPSLLPEACRVAVAGALAGYVYWRVARPDRQTMAARD